jgi:hypothetical protein
MVDLRSSLLLAALLGASLFVLSGCAEQALATRGGAEDGGLYYDPEDPFADDDDDWNPPDEDDDDGADDDDDDDQTISWVEVISYEPAAGATDHHYRAPIQVTFSDRALSASVNLYDAGTGFQLPLGESWSDDGTVLTATPAAFLDPLTSYSVLIDLGDASLEYDFSTSAVGTPVGDELDPEAIAAALDGRLYEIEFSQVSSSTAPALGALMRQLDGGPAWLWQVDFDDSLDGLALNTGLGDVDSDGAAVEQDLCTATQFLGSTASATELFDPYFASNPGLFTLELGDVAVVFEDGWVDGDFAPDGAALVEIGFRGWLRADSITELLDTGSCDWLNDQADSACEVCPSGDGQCSWIEVTGMQAAETTIDFGYVDAEDVTDCPDALEPLDCSMGSSRGSTPLVGLLLAASLVGCLRRRRLF